MGPTRIGLPEPQRHTLELPNYSDTALEYSLDLTELDALNDANYAFPVLQCEAPAGEIPAGGVARVRSASTPSRPASTPWRARWWWGGRAAAAAGGGSCCSVLRAPIPRGIWVWRRRR